MADTAVVLDCAEGTVKSHLHKARVALARDLGLLADAGTDAGTEEDDQ